MSAFLRELREAKIVTEPQESQGAQGACFLELSTAHFPDDQSWQRKSLLVRDCYKQLYDIVRQRARTLVSGTPGIGKSWWIWYAMWRLQQEATPPAIVWDSRLNLKRRVLFHNGKALVGDRNCFKRELGDRSTWYFCDGVVPHRVAARAIMVCYPERKLYKNFTNDGAAMLVMPVWSKAELDLCHARLYPDFDKQRMEGLYNKYGGVPHNVLEYPSVNPEVLDLHELNYGLRALLAISTEEVAANLRLDHGGSEGIHFLLHVEADDEQYLKGYTMASRYVAERIMEMYCQSCEHKMRMFLGAVCRGESYGPVRRGLFEQLAHVVLCKGGTFPIRALDTASSSFPSSKVSTPGIVMDANSTSGCLTLEACQRCSFAASDLAGKVAEWNSTRPIAPEYLVPESASYPGIDALMLPQCLFKMTMQQEVRFDPTEVSVLLDTLPAATEYCFFFVVPSSLKDFKVLDITNLAGRAQHLKFFVLTIDVENDAAAGSKRPRLGA